MATSETPELVTMHPQMTLHAARLVLKKALSEAQQAAAGERGRCRSERRTAGV